MIDIQVRILTDPAFRKPLLSFSTDVLVALSVPSWQKYN